MDGFLRGCGGGPRHRRTRSGVAELFFFREVFNIEEVVGKGLLERGPLLIERREALEGQTGDALGVKC